MDLLQIETDDITITSAAAEAINEMLKKRDLKDHALRVYISGGGCSGQQYGMALEGDPQASDFTFEQHGVKVVVDDVSMGYLTGSVVDYVDDVMGSGFKINNPQATSTCGCGHSFRTDGKDTQVEGAGCR
ncbi:MAG: iron-sulfur cluster insertion protein ErpA [Chloroflexi bacterium]|nr:iron-sulfur cluster insertion protein ErpA [Chloroflexota bacterium]